MVSTPWRASWGWSPTVAHTSSWAAAMAMAAALRRRRCRRRRRRPPRRPGRRPARRRCRPAGRRRRGGSGCRSSARRRAHDAGVMRGKSDVALLDRQPARVAAPPAGGGEPLVLDPARQADAAPDGLRRGGHGRRGQDGHDAQGLEGVAHHGVDRRARARPSTARWSRGRRWSRAPAARWRRARRTAARRPTPRWRLGTASAAAAASGLSGAGRRADAVALAADHGGDPGQEVAEVVGQVGVVAGRPCPRRRSRRRRRR